MGLRGSRSYQQPGSTLQYNTLGCRRLECVVMLGHVGLNVIVARRLSKHETKEMKVVLLGLKRVELPEGMRGHGRLNPVNSASGTYIYKSGFFLGFTHGILSEHYVESRLYCRCMYATYHVFLTNFLYFHNCITGILTWSLSVLSLRKSLVLGKIITGVTGAAWCRFYFSP